jgi:hypothetical protein
MRRDDLNLDFDNLSVVIIRAAAESTDCVFLRLAG